MDLILWRHAEAEPGEPDLGRRLTAKGVKQAERMGAWLERHLPDSARILVSPADRAQQTALGLKRKFKTVDELAPGASAAAVLAAANWPDSQGTGGRRGPPTHARHRRVVPARRRRGLLVGQEGWRVVAVQPRPFRSFRRRAARRHRAGSRLTRRSLSVRGDGLAQAGRHA